jgi:hypothetical protein
LLQIFTFDDMYLDRIKLSENFFEIAGILT